MKIINEFPPNYEEIKKHFDFEDKLIVFTYGDTLYNPSKYEIPANLMAHEETHAKQQNHSEEGAKEWWERYFRDVEFRVEQEVEAYGVQYKLVKQHIKDRNAVTRFLFSIASDLASPMYGNVLTHAQAESKIRNAAK